MQDQLPKSMQRKRESIHLQQRHLKSLLMVRLLVVSSLTHQSVIMIRSAKETMLATHTKTALTKLVTANLVQLQRSAMSAANDACAASQISLNSECCSPQGIVSQVMCPSV